MRQIIQHVFARRDVDADVAPFLGRYFGEATLHQRLAGGYDLDDRGMAFGNIALDRADQRRRLHAGEQVAEEALLGALERRTRRRLRLPVQRAGFAGDVGCGSAWKRDPVSGVIGVEKGPLIPMV